MKEYKPKKITPEQLEKVKTILENNQMVKKVSFAEYLNSIHPFDVGLMRKAIEGLPDETQIVFGIPENLNVNADWFNVERDWKRPDENKEYLALTFFLSDDYDSRQF